MMSLTSKVNAHHEFGTEAPANGIRFYFQSDNGGR
jgi:hypothetical protein